MPHFPSHLLFDPSLSRAMRDLAVRSLAPASRLQQEEMLLHLLAPLLLSHAEDAGAFPQPRWEHLAIKRTKEYLQAHYAQEVPLQELASVANLGPFHLSRLFRQAVGLPPHAYQTKLRLEHAKNLLAQGCGVGYVASETGFLINRTSPSSLSGTIWWPQEATAKPQDFPSWSPVGALL